MYRKSNFPGILPYETNQNRFLRETVTIWLYPQHDKRIERFQISVISKRKNNFLPFLDTKSRDRFGDVSAQVFHNTFLKSCFSLPFPGQIIKRKSGFGCSFAFLSSTGSSFSKISLNNSLKHVCFTTTR